MYQTLQRLETVRTGHGHQITGAAGEMAGLDIVQLRQSLGYVLSSILLGFDKNVAAGLVLGIDSFSLIRFGQVADRYLERIIFTSQSAENRFWITLHSYDEAEVTIDSIPSLYLLKLSEMFNGINETKSGCKFNEEIAVAVHAESFPGCRRPLV